MAKDNKKATAARRHSMPTTIGGYENLLISMIEKRTGAESPPHPPFFYWVGQLSQIHLPHIALTDNFLGGVVFPKAPCNGLLAK